MANIVFQYSTLCILSLFIGIGLCTRRPMILNYRNANYAAWGEVEIGEWTIGYSGLASKTSGGGSYVYLYLCEAFKPYAEGNQLSMRDDGIIRGGSFYVHNLTSASIDILFKEPTSTDQPKLQDLVNESKTRLPEDWIKFHILEIETMRDYIKCTISPGDSRQKYPDARVESPSGRTFLGYKNASTKHVRIFEDVDYVFTGSTTETSSFKVSNVSQYNVNAQPPEFNAVKYRKNEFVVEMSMTKI